MEIVYKGENQCQGIIRSLNKRCENLAYYVNPSNGQLLCGVHSKSLKDRVELPKNPNKDALVKEKLIKQREECDQVANENKRLGKFGQVVCTKLKMMKNPQDIQGFLKVFPNFKHENRKDGYGCSSLSPKSIGPIDHKQPNLPIAKNLENFHQFNKVFPWEVDSNGDILPSFFEKQIEAYNDPIPHRHKLPHSEMQLKKRSLNDNTNVNTPLFSVHLTMDGGLRKFCYLESRYFYCHHYEKHVQNLPQFNHLKDLLKNGYNLQIVGYDAYPLTKIRDNESDVDMFDRFYLDVYRPFGHELVLASMLIIPESINYPWNIYYRRFSYLYRDCFPNKE